jgi:hypothetical protein
MGREILSTQRVLHEILICLKFRLISIRKPDLLVIILILALLILSNSSLSNTVQISLSSLRDSSSTLGANFNNANLLESLEDLAVNGAGGVDMMGGAGPPVLLATVSLAETADTDRFAEVDMASDSSCADVEPINRLRGKLLHVSGLYSINPARNLELALTFQESSIGVNELLSINIADGNARHDRQLFVKKWTSAVY